MRDHTGDLDAVQGFAALSHETRLIVFRAIMRAGPQGVTAGALAERAQVSPSNLSAHLTVLTNSGLVTMRRDGRRRYYAPALSTVSQLVRFLVEDCCDGHPDVCAQLPAASEPAATGC
jgi:DNA-binding transcriptional ArsR family regulator